LAFSLLSFAAMALILVYFTPVRDWLVRGCGCCRCLKEDTVFEGKMKRIEEEIKRKIAQYLIARMLRRKKLVKGVAGGAGIGAAAASVD
jgi:hypothetical protein